MHKMLIIFNFNDIDAFVCGQFHIPIYGLSSNFIHIRIGSSCRIDHLKKMLLTKSYAYSLSYMGPSCTGVKFGDTQLIEVYFESFEFSIEDFSVKFHSFY